MNRNEAHEGLQWRVVASYYIRPRLALPLSHSLKPVSALRKSSTDRGVGALPGALELRHWAERSTLGDHHLAIYHTLDQM